MSYACTVKPCSAPFAFESVSYGVPLLTATDLPFRSAQSLIGGVPFLIPNWYAVQR